MIKESEIIGYQGRKIYCRYTEPSDSPSALVILIHGMQEYCARYDWFANKLAAENIMFFATDLRGHGKNMQDGKPGLDDGDIYLNIVEDQKAIIKQLKLRFPHTPLILFGHSYGSFITQRFVRDGNDDISKIILCGSSYMNTPIVNAARIIAFLSKLFKGRKSDANLIEKLSIRSYGNSFENKNWLSRDEEIFNKYSNDDMCGQVFPVAFYESMFKNLPKNYKNIKYGNDVLIISGTADPVGEFSKGVKKLEQTYLKQGVKASLKLYDGARHELLNETNREEVFEDILKFIKG
ncbi:MAG: alpha/beta fold hydrolase [Clostridia bacterium]|nr:alpha/beta fold hydrolase [Clostridia bacterium]